VLGSATSKPAVAVVAPGHKAWLRRGPSTVPTCAACVSVRWDHSAGRTWASEDGVKTQSWILGISELQKAPETIWGLCENMYAFFSMRDGFETQNSCWVRRSSSSLIFFGDLRKHGCLKVL